MTPLDALIRLQQEPGTNLRQIAQASGVPYETLRKLHRGSTPNPRYQTVEKLRAHYEGHA